MGASIVVKGLSKRFFRSPSDRPWTFQDLFSSGFRKSLKGDEFWALRDINFSLESGKMMGVIGRNGAGKTTLLRLIGGVIEADQGQIVTQGRLGSLIDLGAGFHHDLTGRENVFVNGVISGLTRREVAENFDSIVAFAELQDFIDSPLRIYSLGMQMRLAFAIAVHIQPEILLIDEVLAVGDISFQNKCLEQINYFKTTGCAILLVSHDHSVVSKMCDEVVWLDNGKLAAQDKAQVVISQYLAKIEDETRRRTPNSPLVGQTQLGNNLKLNENRFGSLEMEIEAVRLQNKQGQEIRVLASGEALTIEIDYIAPKPVADPIFGVTITREDGVLCWESSTQSQVLPATNLLGKGSLILSLERLDLAEGRYYIDVGVYRQNWTYAYDYHWHVYTLEIISPSSQEGFLLPPHTWKFEEKY